MSMDNVQIISCPKCDLTISSICSKCNKEVEVSKLDDGCVVQITKCVECTDTPVIKDVCTEN
jgi:hypothetical protein